MLDKLDFTIHDIDSIVHRVNPSIKFIGLIIYTLICFLPFHNILFILNIAFVFLLILLSNVKYTRYLKVLWNLKFFIIIYYLFTLNTLGLELRDIHIFLFKVLFFIYYVKVIEFTTTKESVGRGLGFIINLFNLIGFSVRRIEMFIINIISYCIMMITNNRDYIHSLEYKGVNYSHANILDKGKIIVSNIKRVNEFSKEDMKRRKRDIESKNYNAKRKRAYSYRNRFNVFDILYLVYNIGLLVFYVLVVRS